MLPALFAALALFAYSLRFFGAFSIPKLLVLCAGLLPFAAAAMLGAYVDLRRALTNRGLLVLYCAFLSTCFAADPYLAFVGQHNRFALGLLGLGVVFIYHVAAASSPKPERGLKVLALAGVVLGLHALAQWQGLFPGLTENITGHRAISTIGAPTDLGLILAVLLPLALAESPVYGLAVGLGLVSSCTRGAWIAAAVGVLLTQSRKTVMLTLTLLAVGAASSTLISRRPWGRSDAGRIATWKIGLSAIPDDPILGIGPDSYELAFRRHKTPEFVAAALSGSQVQSDAHNDLLQVLITGGLFGLFAYLVLVAGVFTAVSGPAFGALAALFVVAKLNPVPLEGLVLGGVICGLASKRPSLRRPLAPAAAKAVVACSVGAFGIAAWLAVADFYACPLDFVSVITATNINPFNVEYKARVVNLGIDEINKTHDPALRLAIVNELGRQAKQAMRLRPRVSMSWNIAGVHEEVARQLGLPGDPSRYLRETLELDPMHEQMRYLAGAR